MNLNVKYKLSNYYATIVVTFILFTNTFSANDRPLRGSGLCFTENKGQVADMNGNRRTDILYTGDGKGISLFIRNTGVSYVLHRTDEMSENQVTEPETQNHYTHRVDMDFAGCNPDPSFVKKDEVEGYKNFYLPHCSNGIIGVKSYNTLIQKNLYNNIDIVYKGSKAEGLKYDIIVRPGGDYRDIQIKYSGADGLRVQGLKFNVETSLGELVEWMPRVYQNINGKIVDIKAEYVLNGSTINFKLGTFNTQFPLVIDPWITYLGGSMNEISGSITTDPAGNAIIAGSTQSLNFPVLGAFQSSLTGSQDAFVSKYNEQGIMQWSTYYGGTYNEAGPKGICSDKLNGDIYITGSTYSSDFPIGALGGQNIFLNTYPGSTCAFLVKLSSAGIRQWSTLYGSYPGFSAGMDVDTDMNSNVILYGKTSSQNNIATTGVFQAAIASANANDAFVAKFSSTGNRLWASYCGGTRSETPTGVSCDLNNNIYIVGSTYSIDFPVSTGAHQPNPGGGNSPDAFLFKFNPSGQRVWATYYGGPQFEEGTSVQVDNNGDVYIGGRSNSLTGISTNSSYQPAKATSGTSSDAFLSKFGQTGQLTWATYLGGSVPVINVADSYITGIAVDKNNNVVVTGDTYCVDFPVTSCAYQTNFIGTEDQFVTSFDLNGNIICSGYLGTGNASSPNNETYIGGGNIAASGNFAYLCAYTQCNYPVTSNAFQAACGGQLDAAIAMLCISSCGLPKTSVDFTANKTVLCNITDSVNFNLQTGNSCNSGNTTYLWSFEGATPSGSTEQNPQNIKYDSSGYFRVKLIIETPCGKDSILKNNYIDVANHIPIASFTANPQPANITSPTINFLNLSTGSASWLWSFGDEAVSSSSLENPWFIYMDSGSYIVKLVVANEYGCTDTTEGIIKINGNEYNFYAPNSFTPNGDGLNDFFIPKNTGIAADEYFLCIYNRWGELIFSTNDPGKGWSGTKNNSGTLVQTDTYVWKIKIKDEAGETHNYIGKVSLIR